LDEFPPEGFQPKTVVKKQIKKKDADEIAVG